MKMTERINKLVLTIIVSIILTIILTSLVNLGLSIFLEDPKYEEFCGYIDAEPITQNGTVVCAEDTKECSNGITRTLSREPTLGCEFPPCSDKFKTCQEEFKAAQKPYNQIKYYILAGIGFILLLIGLFSPEMMVQLTGLATGGILVTEGIVINFENKVVVFISLLIILAIFGIIAWKVIKRN